MHHKTILAAGLLSLISLGAHAQAPGVQLHVDSGFYIGAGIGRAKTGEGCLGNCDTTDQTWNAYAGYQLNRFFAVEGAYSRLGEATVSGTLFGVPVTSRLSTDAWELVGVGMLPITDKFSIYGKLGVFRYDSDASTAGAFVGTSSGKGTEFTVGGGLQYAFTGNIGARFEWQRYNDVGAGVPGLQKDDISVWRLSGRYRF